MKQVAQGCNSAAQESKLGPLSRESDALPLREPLQKIIIITIIMTSFAPMSSKIKLSGATKPWD